MGSDGVACTNDARNPWRGNKWLIFSRRAIRLVRIYHNQYVDDGRLLVMQSPPGSRRIRADEKRNGGSREFTNNAAGVHKAWLDMMKAGIFQQEQTWSAHSTSESVFCALKKQRNSNSRSAPCFSFPFIPFSVLEMNRMVTAMIQSRPHGRDSCNCWGEGGFSRDPWPWSVG
ncbi:unnamed protein product [Pylaiella littoralis]